VKTKEKIIKKMRTNQIVDRKWNIRKKLKVKQKIGIRE